MKIKKMSESIAVLMTCHNRRDKTLACLKSVYEQKETPYKVVIYLVDDGSSDGTSDAVRLTYPDVNILAGNGNLFWNKGMHKAFGAAIDNDHKFYVWLNDDCELYKDTFLVLTESFASLEQESDSSLHIIGSAFHEIGNEEFTYGGVRKYKNWLGRVKQLRIKPSSGALQACQAVNGNCVLISREVVRLVGNLDPVFTHRWGDHDYCFRALEESCSVWLAPGYRGTCDANPIDGTWEDVTLPLSKRFNALRSQRGYYPPDYKVYLKRHRGVWWWLNYIAPYLKIIVSQITGTLKPQ